MKVSVKINKELAIRAGLDLPDGFETRTHVKSKVELCEDVLKSLTDNEKEALIDYHVKTKREVDGARFGELSSAEPEEFIATLKEWTVAIEKAQQEALLFYEEAIRWSEQYGSERLKLVAREGFMSSSMSLYRDERLDHDLRELWDYIADVDGERDKRTLNPALEAFALLERARKDIPDAELVSWRVSTPGHKTQNFQRYWACTGTFLGQEVVLMGEPQ